MKKFFSQTMWEPWDNKKAFAGASTVLLKLN